MNETTPPPGFQTIGQLATDSSGTGAGTPRNYTNNTNGTFTVNVTSGNTTTIPNNNGLTNDDNGWQWNSGRFANRRVNPTRCPQFVV